MELSDARGRSRAARPVRWGGSALCVLLTVTGCASELEVDPKWSDSTYFALREVDGRYAVVGWNDRDLQPRIAQDMGEEVIDWEWSRNDDVSYLSWVPKGEDTQFVRLRPEDGSIMRIEGVARDTGAFAVLGEGVAYLEPGNRPRVVALDASLKEELWAGQTGIDSVVHLEAVPGGGVVVAGTVEGQVVVREFDVRGRVRWTWETGRTGFAAGVASDGEHAVVAIGREGAGSSDAVLVRSPSGKTREVAGVRGPDAVALVGPGTAAVAGTDGETRVVSRFDLSSGEVLTTSDLSSPSPVVGIAPSDAGGVMVLQSEQITEISAEGRQRTEEAEGMASGRW